MQPDFWHQRWRSNQIGFHRPSVDPYLRDHWPTLGLRPAARVFVPLCGKSVDLLWLRDQDFLVVGVELSEIALETFAMENGVAARRRSLEAFDRYETAKLELYRGDFFALTQSILGPTAAVYDRAALISWSPELRSGYVDHMLTLTPPGTSTLLVTLEYPQEQAPGPPFSVGVDEIQRLYSPHHQIRELERRDVLADEPRMRARGASSIFEVCYRLIRHTS